jgi:ribosome-interacting GTPase 1
VVLVGPANAGKSALVDRLTHAEPEVAAYPLTTRLATPGMMPFEDVAIQLVDLPPVCEEHVDPWVWDLIKAADMVWLVLAVESSLEGLETTERLLAGRGIELVPVGAEPPEERRPGWRYKRALMVLTGLDRAGAREDLDILAELLEVDWPRVAVSVESGEGLEELAARTFEALDVIRIYTKQPGKEPDLERPFTVPEGATVGDLARTIHKDLADQFKFARVWGDGVFEGQRVPSNHVLEAGNVVEIHF